jgi:hypothetical protein
MGPQDVGTPDWLFSFASANIAKKEISLDLAADKILAKTHIWIGPGGIHDDLMDTAGTYKALWKDDGVAARSCWLNPPFSRSGEFVDAAIRLRESCSRVNDILILLRHAQTTYVQELERIADCYEIGRVKFSGYPSGSRDDFCLWHLWDLGGNKRKRIKIDRQ